MSDKTLISEVEYAVADGLEVNNQLLTRVIKELKRLTKENARLDKANTSYMWEKYPDRMGQ